MSRDYESAIAAVVRRWRDDDADEPPQQLRERFATWLWNGEPDGDFPASALEDPHALGWLHQYLGEAERKAAFDAHTSAEAKHPSQITTTQVYTPRWVAEWLADAAVTDSSLSVLDPACGGGQMLLAAVHRLVELGATPAGAYGRVRGVDLDQDAVWTCREVLKLDAARTLGTRDADVEAQIDANIVTGDALADEVRAADVVLTNPPYMGSRSMPPALKDALKAYQPFHHDLYLAFIRRCAELSQASMGILAQQTLWYLKRFEAAREWMLDRGTLTHFAHLGHGVFGALTGEKATVAAFVWRHGASGDAANFWDLREATDKPAALTTAPTRAPATDYRRLPGSPLAFWLPEPLVVMFETGTRLGDIADVPGSQNKTGRNAQYVKSVDEVDPDDPRWVPYSKGGRYAPWWGNWDWVVDWSEEARQFYATNPTSNLLDEKYWFREGLCYADFGGSDFNARWMPEGCVFDMAGPAILVDRDDRDLLAALLVVLNSTVSRTLLNALNPTLHYQVRDVRNLPLPDWGGEYSGLVELGHELVATTRAALPGKSTWDELSALEEQADRAVARVYDVPELFTAAAARRRHHRVPAGEEP